MKRNQKTNATRETFENAIRDNLSPGAVAVVISLLQTAGNYSNGTNDAAINQVNWLRETLLDVIGVDGFNGLMEEMDM